MIFVVFFGRSAGTWRRGPGRKSSRNDCDLNNDPPDRYTLNTNERSELINGWIALTEMQIDEQKAQSAQIAPIESKRTDGKGHRPEGGINAAARELGVERTEAQRVRKISSLPPEVKQAARAAGLDDN